MTKLLWLAALVCGFLGLIAIIGGVYVLAGFGCALVAASVPLLGVSAVLFRGLTSGD